MSVCSDPRTGLLRALEAGSAAVDTAAAPKLVDKYFSTVEPVCSTSKVSFKDMAGREALHWGLCSCPRGHWQRRAPQAGPAACLSLDSGLHSFPPNKPTCPLYGCLGRDAAPDAQPPGQSYAKHWLVVAAVQPRKQCPLGSSQLSLQHICQCK